MERITNKQIKNKKTKRTQKTKKTNKNNKNNKNKMSQKSGKKEMKIAICQKETKKRKKIQARMLRMNLIMWITNKIRAIEGMKATRIAKVMK